jgi:CBS domain containing-hemolysin-like protein
VEKYLVKDLMVPISEYATVSEGSTLLDAVLALEKAQEIFDHTQYLHRAILILDKNKQVIGKVSQLDTLRALEPKNEQLDKIEDINRYGFSQKFIMGLREQNRLNNVSMEDMCVAAAGLKVESLMQAPTEGEFIDENASVNSAIHQLVQGSHMSLLVTREKDIVGILRSSDVFAAVFHSMKACKLA